jgi:hypothetical protein
MAQQFTMPAGGTGPAQTPAASAHGDNPKVAMASSDKASESKPIATMQGDMSKMLVQGTQTPGEMPVKIVQPTSAFDGDGLPGGGDAPGGSNVEATPDGFPRGAPSRAPVVGVTHKPRNMSRVQNRK